LKIIEESIQYAAIVNNESIHIGKKLNDRFIALTAIIPPQ